MHWLQAWFPEMEVYCSQFVIAVEGVPQVLAPAASIMIESPFKQWEQNAKVDGVAVC